MSALQELNYGEAAAHVGIRETAFRRLCRNGEGPKARRDGRTMRFLPEHLDEWIVGYKDAAYTNGAAKPKAKSKRGAKLPKELE